MRAAWTNFLRWPPRPHLHHPPNRTLRIATHLHPPSPSPHTVPCHDPPFRPFTAASDSSDSDTSIPAKPNKPRGHPPKNLTSTTSRPRGRPPNDPVFRPSLPRGRPKKPRQPKPPPATFPPLLPPAPETLAVPTMAGLPGPRPFTPFLSRVADVGITRALVVPENGPQPRHPLAFDALVAERRFLRFTPQEDQYLAQAVMQHGENFPRIRDECFPYRTVSSVAARWQRINPRFRRGAFGEEERKVLREAVERVGKKWTVISKTYLPWRSPVQIASCWKSSLAVEVGAGVGAAGEKEVKTEKEKMEGLAALSLQEPRKTPVRRRVRKPWTTEENEILLKGLEQLGHKWTTIAEDLPGRTVAEVFCHYWNHLHRYDDEAPDTPSKYEWTPEEDEKLLTAMNSHWHSPSVWLDIRRTAFPNVLPRELFARWKLITDPEILKIPFTPRERQALRDAVGVVGKDFGRIARLGSFGGRTSNQLAWEWERMEAKEGRRPWTPEEDEEIMRLVGEVGRKWATIAERVEGRTPLQLKTRYRQLALGVTVRGPYTPEEDRVILEARDVEGKSFFEIAQKVRRNLSLVYKRYQKLKQDQGVHVGSTPAPTTKEPVVYKLAPFDKDEAAVVEESLDRRMPGCQNEWKGLEVKLGRRAETIAGRARTAKWVWTDELDRRLCEAVREVAEGDEEGVKPLKEFLRALEKGKPPSPWGSEVRDKDDVDVSPGDPLPPPPRFNPTLPRASLSLTPAAHAHLTRVVCRGVDWTAVGKQAKLLPPDHGFTPLRLERRWVFLANFEASVGKPVVTEGRREEEEMRFWEELKRAVGGGEVPVVERDEKKAYRRARYHRTMKTNRFAERMGLEGGEWERDEE
ncbi:Myblike DNAbinding domain-containing protein [Phlyctochytrium bullatum]|nr:Myblike DNAbinding domain-containing protein [Phlyctochytrium bullatum]